MAMRRKFVIALLRLLALPFVVVATFAMVFLTTLVVICPVIFVFLLPRMLIALVLGIVGLFTGFISPRHGEAMWARGGDIIDGGAKWLERVVDPVADVMFWLPDKVYPL